MKSREVLEELWLDYNEFTLSEWDRMEWLIEDYRNEYLIVLENDYSTAKDEVLDVCIDMEKFADKQTNEIADEIYWFTKRLNRVF